MLAGGGRQLVTDDLTDARTIAGIATLMLWFETTRPAVSNRWCARRSPPPSTPVALVAAMENPFGPARGSGLLPPALPGHSHQAAE